MKKRPIKNYLVQCGEDCDNYLHTKLFPVNMRLYIKNRKYKNVILAALGHMKDILNMKFSDYTPLRGISGANVGIPFNIISVVSELHEDDTPAKVEHMINPIILKRESRKKIVKSNCGSLRLKKPIEVERNSTVLVSFFKINGDKIVRRYEGTLACTIQHEVEHNNGILITDL